METGRWTIKETNVEGWDLLAPTSYIEATEKAIKAKTGGCGPGWLGDLLVPDTMLGESVFLACQIHDWMYGEGETPKDKRDADRVFLWNMTVLIQDTPHGDTKEDQKLDLIRLRTVMTYYEAVSYAGSDSFNAGVSVRAKDLT